MRACRCGWDPAEWAGAALQRSTEEAVITLGSWPDWVAAVGTSLAFIIAAVSYFRSVRDATKAQARLVYASLVDIKSHAPGEESPLMLGGASIGGGEGYAIKPGAPGVQATQIAVAPLTRAVVRVHNGSDELMGSVKVQLYNSGLKKLFDRATMFTGPIEPHNDYVADISVINEQYQGEPSVGMVIVFQDSSNRWWKRHGFQPIERIHDDPNNTSDSPHERAMRERNVLLAGGVGFDPEPKPSLIVRWHRFWRRMRGKQAIP